MNKVGTLAECLKCGQEFVLTGDEEIQIIRGEMQFEHYSDDCGGFGIEIGSWG